MHATHHIPEAWQIAELERLRRIRESEYGERAELPLPVPPPPPPAHESPERQPGATVVVIDLW